MTPENIANPYDAAILDLEARIRNMQVALETLKQLRAQAGGGRGSCNVFYRCAIWRDRSTTR